MKKYLEDKQMDLFDNFISLTNNKKNVINRSLFEVTTVNFALLSTNESELLIANKKQFLEDYIKLLKDNNFDTAITANTNHKENVKLRHQMIQKIITKHTNHAY